MGAEEASRQEKLLTKRDVLRGFWVFMDPHPPATVMALCLGAPAGPTGWDEALTLSQETWAPHSLGETLTHGMA